VSSESKVMALLEEGNPATEVDGTVWSSVDAPSYLAALQDHRTGFIPPLVNRPGWMDGRFAVAALVLFFVGVAALFLLRPNAEEAPVVSNPPTSTTAPEPTTTTELSNSELSGFWTGARLTLHFGEGEYHIVEGGLVTDSGTYEVSVSGELELRTPQTTARCQAGESGIYRISFTAEGLDFDPIADECDSRRLFLLTVSFTRSAEIAIPDSALDVVRPWSQGALTPGRYATTVFRAAFSFVLPPRWRSAPATEQQSAFAIERSEAWLVFLTLGDDTVEDRVASLSDQDNVRAGDTEKVEIGGFEGVTFDFNVTETVSLFRVTGGSGEATPEETIRAWVVDVEGTVVTIYFGSPRLTFGSLVEDGNTVVDSIIWGDTN